MTRDREFMTGGPQGLDDAALDDVVRRAAPRAPETLLPQVLAAVAASERARRRRRWRVGVGGVAGALAVAAVVLLVLRTRSTFGPGLSPAPAGAEAGPWRLAAAAGDVIVPGGGVGDPLPAAAALTVAAGGSARLERGGEAFVLARGLAVLRTEGATLTLLGGTARLGGDGIDVTTAPARIHTMGRDADVELTLQGRSDMDHRFLVAKKGVVAGAALGTALLAIHVYRGQAVVERRPGAPPLTLAAGDGALMGASGPPLVVRAPVAAPQAVAAVTPRKEGAREALQAMRPTGARPLPPSGAARPTAATEGEEGPPPLNAELDGALDKEVVRAGIQKIIPQIKTCYESALEKAPQLNGRLLVKFKIRAQDGKGVVGEGEIQPDSDAALLAEPETGQCILDALAVAEFPAPEDGGEVTVSYPFVLMATPPPLGRSRSREP
ncbi:MAG TPA: AgmX/PglI C-terminal domain-containing protein [Polyangia bacterium]|nr:AgmX/PglI C-terminal domain-containing protein [Polyangia bacterium]